MSNELRVQIYNNLNLKETDELVEIWKTNNRVVWSDTTFEIIKEILTSREVEIPEQEEPVYEHSDEVMENDSYGFTDEELKILDDENPPDYYDPFEVLKISKWGEIIAIASIVIALVSSLLQFPNTKNIALSYFPYTTAWNIAAYLIAMVSTSVAVGAAIVFTYFPLKLLANILKILMEMEYNSRKAK